MALVQRVIFRRKPGVSACLGHLSYLVVEGQAPILHSQAELLTASLLPWERAIALPIPDDGGGDFLEAERPDMRARIANLAGALNLWYTKHLPTVQVPPE